MDIEELKGALESVLGAEDVAPENQEKVRENMETISGIVSTVELAYEDGIGWDDITVIGELVGPIMNLASSFDDFEGLSRRQFVIEVVWLIYKTIDTYPDGNRNNVNVPYLIGPIESRFERAIIAFATGMAVDALYKRMKNGGEV
jgi:hypothetical protein